MNIGEFEQRRAFAIWLRTGRLPTVSDVGVELKFNPWHDPDSGQFTHAGGGRYFGPNGARSSDRRAHSGRKTTAADKRVERQSRGPVRKVAEFVGGVGEGIYDVGKETVTGLHEVITTNPKTTVRNFGAGIAKTIDSAIAAQETPAYIQVRKTANAIANAPAHDIGYATGRLAGNVALTVAPGAAAAKVSAIRRAAIARPRETFLPPQIKWVKENLGKDSPAKAYNDSATGAIPDQAPALMRTLPDGKQRPVKFDGIDGDYLIDRKLKVVDLPNSRAQLLRQSDVLSQHKLIALLEVPSSTKKLAATKLLDK